MTKRTYEDLLSPKKPYAGGRENYYQKYDAIDANFINEYESFHSIKMPADVSQLLLHQNGGHIDDPDSLIVESLIGAVNSLTLDISNSRWLFGMIPLHDWLDSRGDYDDGPDCPLSQYREEHKRLIIIDGDGHHFAAMDFRDSESCVGIVDVELECGYGVTKHADRFQDLFFYW